MYIYHRKVIWNGEI